jgi:AraC-like DNA-binding protein
MHHLVGLVGTPTEREQLRAVLSRRNHLYCASDWKGVIDRMRDVPADCIVVDCDAPAHCDTAAFDRLRRDFPNVAVVGYVSLIPGKIHQILPLIARGLTCLAFKHADSSGIPLAEAVELALERGWLSECRTLLAAHVSSEAAAIILVALEIVASDDENPIGSLTAQFALSRRQLNTRLYRLALPPVLTLITYCRLVYAVALLRDRARSINAISATLGFSTSAGLRNAIARHVGLRAGALREPSSLPETLLRLFGRQEPPVLTEAAVPVSDERAATRSRYDARARPWAEAPGTSFR